MTRPNVFLITLALAGLSAAWACGEAPSEKVARSKRADPALGEPSSRGATKAAAARKPGDSAMLKALGTSTDLAPGVSVEGTLGRGDAVLDEDGSFVDYYSYRG